jgi:hypothetical protein
LRDVILCIDAFDGFCWADTYCVTVHVTDVNEPPVVVPAYNYYNRDVYEGFVSTTRSKLLKRR